MKRLNYNDNSECVFTLKTLCCFDAVNTAAAIDRIDAILTFMMSLLLLLCAELSKRCEKTITNKQKTFLNNIYEMHIKGEKTALLDIMFELQMQEHARIPFVKEYVCMES